MGDWVETKRSTKPKPQQEVAPSARPVESSLSDDLAQCALQPELADELMSVEASGEMCPPRHVTVAGERLNLSTPRPQSDAEGSGFSGEDAATLGLDLATSFTPGVSNVRDLTIAATGEDPLYPGIPVPGWERALAGVFAVPGVGNVAKAAYKGAKGVGRATKALMRGSKSSSKVDNAWNIWQHKNAGRVVPDGQGGHRQMTRAEASDAYRKETPSANPEWDMRNPTEYDSKGNPISREPLSIMDEMTMQEARSGGGRRIIEGLSDRRYEGWDKYEVVTKGKSGTTSEVHYNKNPKTGEMADFKHVKHEHWHVDTSSKNLERMEKLGMDPMKRPWQPRSVNQGRQRGVSITEPFEPKLDQPKIRPCFAPGTPILMADGSWLPIEEVAVGDLVLAYDESTERVVQRPVCELHVTPPKRVIEVDIDGIDTLVVTPRHRFFVIDRWIPIEDVPLGTELLFTDADGSLSTRTLRARREVEDTTVCHNLEVFQHHSYFAGGILVHNGSAGS